MAKDILKQYEDVMRPASDLLNRKKIVIPVSPRIDIGLGGGIIEGSFTVLTGKEKAGKTICALTIAANGQKPEYGNRHVYFLNIEGRTQPRDLLGIEELCLDDDRFTLIESRPGNILNAGQFLSIAEKLIHTKPGAIVIIDSFSSLVTEGELSGELTDATVMEQAKLLAKFCRRNGTIIPVNNIVLIGITHKMSSVARGRGPSTQEKSGNAIRYQTDNKIDATSFSYEKSGEEIIGQKVYWKVITSALGAPGQTFEGYIKYGIGLDKYREVLELAKDFNIITLSGAWYKFDEETKVCGIDKAANFLKENPEMFDRLNKEIRQTVGLDESI